MPAGSADVVARPTSACTDPVGRKNESRAHPLALEVAIIGISPAFRRFGRLTSCCRSDELYRIYPTLLYRNRPWTIRTGITPPTVFNLGTRRSRRAGPLIRVPKDRVTLAASQLRRSSFVPNCRIELRCVAGMVITGAD